MGPCEMAGTVAVSVDILVVCLGRNLDDASLRAGFASLLNAIDFIAIFYYVALYIAWSLHVVV